MNTNQRFEIFLDKIRYYSEEVYGLKDDPWTYKFGFGLLLALLVPLLLMELLTLLLFGKDLGMFVRSEPVAPPVLVSEEVPDSLHELIPLALKFGIGDDGERGEALDAASREELMELEQKVQQRSQELSDWFDSFPEDGITDTAAFFLYLASACEEIPSDE